MSGKYSIQPTSPMKVFSSENYINETHHSEFKVTVMDAIKECKKFKEYTKMCLNKLKENKCLSDAQGNTHIG